MRVEERDKLILREVERWRVCGSRHISFLTKRIEYLESLDEQSEYNYS